MFFIFFAAIQLQGCVNKRQQPELQLEVTIGTDKKVWNVILEEKGVSSCYLSTNAKKGMSRELESGTLVEVGYEYRANHLIIETYPGICDGGVQVELAKVNGKYQGILFSRTIGGDHEIGFVREL
jgi:hypothetical protein